MSVASAQRVLVPVGDSVTIRNTVGYVVRESLSEDAETASLHFVYPASWQSRNLDEPAAEEATELLDRVRTWVREDLDVEDDEELPIDVQTSVIGGDEYLFSPRDYAETLLEYARNWGIDHIVLDPEFKPGSRGPLLAPLSAELNLASEVTYEEAPVERQIRGRRLLRRAGSLGTFLTVFGLSFLFYQVLGGFAGTFDLITGTVSAGIVAAVLSGITFDRPISPMRAVRSTLRWVLYVPYLLWEIAKANVQVVYIVLHPSLPIDPSMERIRPAVPLGLPVTTLANSITLTPGTITVDVRQREFHVHALAQSSRDGLYDGALERAVRFVFFGRDAARIPTLRERGQGPDGDRERDAVDGQTDDQTTPTEGEET